MLRSYFTDHPASVDETYGEHMAVAGSFGARLLGASLACFVHAVFPWLFEKTGSSTIGELHDRMVANRTRLKSGGGQGAANGARG